MVASNRHGGETGKAVVWRTYNVFSSFWNVVVPAMRLEHARTDHLGSCQILIQVMCQLNPRRHLSQRVRFDLMFSTMQQA